MLIVASLACSALDDTPTATAAKAPTKAAAATATSAPATAKGLFQDDFSNSKNGWAISENDNGSAAYLNGEYVFKLKRSKWMKWTTTPDEKDYTNVHLEVTVKDLSTDKTTLPGFGFICNFQDNDNFMYAGAAIDGVHALARKVATKTEVLSDPNKNNEWVVSKDITKNASSYRLGLDCTSTGMTMYVDGKKVASVNDTSFKGGAVGLFILSFDKANAEVHYDDFAVTQLK